MTLEDLKTVAQIGRALWADPAQADPQTAETVSAVSLLHLTEERALERAAKALLDQASKRGMAAHTLDALKVGGSRIENPLYALFPQERFLLVALHSGRWSYARLARILSVSDQEIEETAWGIRLKLSRLNPIGSELRTPNCPEYDVRRPWTQRFLDEEIHEGRQRIFLQNHLMVCATCQRALSRCRDIYYAVDKLIPRLGSEGSDGELLFALKELTTESRGIKRPSERSFAESLRIFLRRPDARIALGALIAIVLFKILR